MADLVLNAGNDSASTQSAESVLQIAVSQSSEVPFEIPFTCYDAAWHEVNDSSLLLDLFHPISASWRHHLQKLNSQCSGIDSPLQSQTPENRLNYPKHVYKPLETLRSIRILRLLDCHTPTRTLLGTFYEEDLDKPYPTAWDALSYTWSNPTGALYDQDRDHPWRMVICEILTKDHAQTLQLSSIALQPNLADYFQALVNIHRVRNVPLAFATWIDAICIDQSNKSEIRSQMALMGDVYSRAKVNVWLGKDTTHWHLFKWLHEVIDGPEFRQLCEKKGPKEVVEIMAGYDPIQPRFWDRYLPQARPPTGSWRDCWEAYWRFLDDRRWFERVWTYQEALLAQDLIFICGDDYGFLSYQAMDIMGNLLDASKWRQRLGVHFCHIGQKAHPSKALFHLAMKKRYLSKIMDQRRVAAPQSVPPSKAEWLNIWASACMALRARQCLVEDDKINATFGIAHIFKPNCVPSSLFQQTAGYSPMEAFTWMTIQLLENRIDLHYLSFVGKTSFERRGNIPSWAIDFSTILRHHQVSQVENGSGFDASLCGNINHNDYTRINKTVLVLDGVKVDTLGSRNPTVLVTLPDWCLVNFNTLASVYHNSPELTLNIIWRSLIWECDDTGSPPDQTWAHGFKNWIESNLVLRYLFPSYRYKIGVALPKDEWWSVVKVWLSVMELLKVFGNIAYAPSLSDVSLAIESIEKHEDWAEASKSIPSPQAPDHEWSLAFSQIANSVSPLLEVYKSAFHAPYAQFLSSIMQERKVTITDNKYLVITHLGARETDEIWILKGGRVPYVLRPIDAAAGTYSFVGDCYVHGIMRGEFVNGTSIQIDPRPRTWTSVTIL